jgi:dihydrofolate synthase/folylpolyglutamate synthase
MDNYSEEAYLRKVESIFTRYPSVQKVPFGDAYKPGLDHMQRFSAALGNPHLKYRTIHVAGTNGKGSTASMLASVLSAAGLNTGLYTSPHIEDFRERARILSGGQYSLVPKEYVYDFLCRCEGVME